ncbi:MAG: AAA family ATPase, partial [Candidatus Kapaibacterium sp.]
SDVTGTYVFNPKIVEFELKKGPIFTNVVLVDEINRAPAKTQSALFEVMEEKQVTIEGKTNIMPFPFLVLATQNPIEFEGTYRLPEAQIDRFMFKILIDYPSEASEREVLKIKNENPGHTDISGIKPVISKDDLRKFRSMMYEVHVEDYLLDYINSIVRSTRHNSQIFLGASPRAAISLLFASKAYAALEGRDFVKPEDIHEMALPALRHRIILTSEIEMEGRTEDEVIRGIMANIEIPR